jgi:hypothetical protein
MTEDKLIRELQLYLAAATLGALMGLAYNMLTCRTATVGGITITSCGCQAALVNNATLYYVCAGGGRIIVKLDNMTIEEKGGEGLVFLPTGTRRS